MDFILRVFLRLSPIIFLIALILVKSTPAAFLVLMALLIILSFAQAVSYLLLEMPVNLLRPVIPLTPPAVNLVFLVSPV